MSKHPPVNAILSNASKPKSAARFLSSPFPLLTVFLGAFLSLAAANSYAGNVYDPVSGALSIPVIQVDEASAFSGVFSLISAEPLIWGANNFSPVEKESRTAAVYDGTSGIVAIPEIDVSGKLFDLNFAVTSGCGFAVCLRPILDTLEERGRGGAAIFTEPLSSASTFSCSSCHAMSETDGLASDGFRRPGHDLENANLRSSFKNGQYSSFLEAVNTCVTEWMNAPALAETDTEWTNLLTWFRDQNNDTFDEVVSHDIVQPPADLSDGESNRGRDLFNTRCIVCHGFDGEGTQLAPKITGLGLSAEYIAARTRLSGRSNSATYEGLTGGIMPFWSADRLSDDELIDIAAYVANGAEQSDVTDATDVIEPPMVSGCAMTSSKIGQSASFSRLFHRVSGQATVIDDCTIELSGFNFDGGGIDVRIYAGTDGSFHEGLGGFAISDNLVGISFTDNTLRLTLPEGRSLENFNSLSVWCVAVGVSFGTAFF